MNYLLVSENLANIAKDCDIIHATGSNRCAVNLFIQSGSLNNNAGPAFWKFNSSLLEEKGYITEFKTSKFAEINTST